MLRYEKRELRIEKQKKIMIQEMSDEIKMKNRNEKQWILHEKRETTKEERKKIYKTQNDDTKTWKEKS